MTLLRRLLVILLFAGVYAFPQACTNDGNGNVCAPVTKNTAAVAKHGDGTAADGSWALINHASDTASDTLGCYSSNQVAFADHNATITMVSGGTYTCGQSNHTQGSQPYLTGSMVWKNLNYKPSEMPSGHVTIEVKAKMGRGWSAIWLLGGSGDTSSSPGCQYSSINDGYDNIDNCNWSSDASDSAEMDIVEITPTSYTSAGHNKFINGGSVSCSQSVTSVIDNFHTYHIDWSASAVDMKVDGVDANCNYNSGIPQNPMFLMIEDRQQTGNIDAALPTTTVVQYVQVCDGSTCTSPDSPSGNTLFYDSFVSQATPNGMSVIGGKGIFLGKGTLN